MRIISIIKEAAPSSTETLEEYVKRLSDLAPNAQLQVNEDIEFLPDQQKSSVIIKMGLLLKENNYGEESEENDEEAKNYDYCCFIKHHLDYYERACNNCPEPFKPTF